METLNTIEKITLLLSTSIVCLANLFVLIERAKKSEKQTLSTIIQKLLGLKNTFFVFVIIFIMCSCSNSKFLNRKHTSGKFSHYVKSLKHNTICSDTINQYAFATNQINFKQVATISDNTSEKEIIYEKVESIIKKDSIFIYHKVGRDNVVIVKNNLPNVIIHIDNNGKRLEPKSLTAAEAEKVKRNHINKIKAFVIISLCFSLIPGLGFAFAIISKKLIKRNKKTNPFKGINNYNVLSNIALGLSIVPTLLLLYVLVMLVLIVIFLFGL